MVRQQGACAVMQQFVNTISFLGTVKTPPGVMVSAIESVLRRRHFVRKEFHAEWRCIFTKETLKLARMDLVRTLDKESKAMLRQTDGVIERRMTRKSQVSTVTLERADGCDKCVIKWCNRNWYPAIVIDMWLYARPRLPAGFISVSSDSKSTADELRNALKSYIDERG